MLDGQLRATSTTPVFPWKNHRVIRERSVGRSSGGHLAGVARARIPVAVVKESLGFERVVDLLKDGRV